jgi:hypothetical protein
MKNNENPEEKWIHDRLQKHMEAFKTSIIAIPDCNALNEIWPRTM